MNRHYYLHQNKYLKNEKENKIENNKEKQGTNNNINKIKEKPMKYPKNKKSDKIPFIPETDFQTRKKWRMKEGIN